MMTRGINDPPRVEARGGTIAHVVRLQVGDHEAEANARLIAAAPDLLAALEALAEEEQPACRHGDVERVWKAARAAIAKVRGGR